MNLKRLLEELLVEAVIERVVTSFRSIKDKLPPSWGESHQSMAPFGANWGRGVVGKSGNALVGGASSSHAILKQRTKEDTLMTFYWGYAPRDKTLYLETASIRGPGFTNQVLPKIAQAIVTSKGFQWRVGNNVIREENET